MLDSKALTKIQSVILIAIIAVAAVGGSAAYYLLNGKTQTIENIKIGVCGDLDMHDGKAAWRGATFAAEQINAQGGILGRNLTVIGEDDDSETPPGDIAIATNALTKLITVDKADYIISPQAIWEQTYQDICAEHKTIFISVSSVLDSDTQRVLDNYDKYKYFFRVWATNVTSAIDGESDSTRTVRNYTGFSKVAFLVEDFPFANQFAEGVKQRLLDYGFNVVYYQTFPPGTTDFTSYFAAIEASGAQILSPFAWTQSCYSLVTEHFDRQSPFVLWGPIGLASESNFWNLTDGKCAGVSFVGLPIVSGYPLTNKTVPTREAYMQRWGDIPNAFATASYDAVRFILSDAIKRAGTTETDAVIKALEKTDIETSMARRFVFTSSHDVMIGSAGPNIPSEDYMLVCLFQWQNGTQVPVYPKQLLDEAGASYKYPDWKGPWSNMQTP
jgi:branched-chain amino acid transport system substrate-binding protein